MPTLRGTMSYLAIVLACVVVSCLVSAMVLFMGGGQSSLDLIMLTVIQIGSVPAAIAWAAIGIVACGKHSKESVTARHLYAATPHWLVFSGL